MGGALCRPQPVHEQAPKQETWRERPRLARRIPSRACPEGSLTPWLSVLVSVLSWAWAWAVRAAGAGAVVAADLGLVVRDVRDVFLREVLTLSLVQNLGEMWTAGHHVFESRSVLGAVKARRFAPPA